MSVKGIEMHDNLNSYNTRKWDEDATILSTSRLARLHRRMMLNKMRFSRLVTDKNKIILDLGCGSGPFLKHFHNLGYRNLYGLEPDRCLLSMIPKSIARVTEGYSENMEYADNAFDVIFIYGVLHHLKGLDNYNRTMDEIHRVLKPGGLVFIMEPGRRTIFKLLEGVTSILGRLSKTFRLLSDVIEEEKNDLYFFIEHHSVIRERLREKGFAFLVNKYYLYSWIFTGKKPS